jgi:hypothetical protein
MKYIKTYKIFEADGTFMYDPKIEEILPEYIKVIKGDPKNPLILAYKKSVSRHLGAEVQIPYETTDHNGGRENPDTLEFDIYWDFNTNTKSLSINVEINYGELTASQFSIESPNKVDVIRYTSLHSKDDKSNTIFALDDNSIQSLCNFFNKWDTTFDLTSDNFKFLNVHDNYLPT